MEKYQMIFNTPMCIKDQPARRRYRTVVRVRTVHDGCQRVEGRLGIRPARHQRMVHGRDYIAT